MKKLNLGCGKDIKKGYVNLDIEKTKGVDVVHDINKFPYPFKNDTFEEVYCDNILEHSDDLICVMKELYRISKNGCTIKIIVPFVTNVAGLTVPEHKHFFSAYTFDGLITNPVKKGLGRSAQLANLFQLKKYYYSMGSGDVLSRLYVFFINRLNVHLYTQRLCFIFPISTINYELKVIK